MKKLIIPALISIIALTSCSQALYKDKYDWVKVDRIETKMVKDSVVIVQPVAADSKQEVSVQTATEERVEMQTAIVPENSFSPKSVPGDSLKGNKSTKSEHKKTEKKQAGKVSTGYLTLDMNPRISLKGNGNSNMSTEEKGYLAAGIVILILLIIASIVGPGFLINGLLLLYYGLKLLAAAAVIAAVLWFIWWLLFGSINPGIFFWTMK